MKSHIPLVAGSALAPLAVKAQIVVSTSMEVRRSTSYASLLEGPMASLADHVMDRPDVRSVAILGYN
jgi:hypothetical protein